jgi:hypothetical protein
VTTGATFLQRSLFFRPFFHPFSPGVHQFGPLRFAWSKRIVKLSCSGGQQAISRTVGPCEPGQAGNRAALSIVFPGVSGGSLLDPGFFCGNRNRCRSPSTQKSPFSSARRARRHYPHSSPQGRCSFFTTQPSARNLIHPATAI